MARNKAILESSIYSVYFWVEKNQYTIEKIGDFGENSLIKNKKFTSGIKLRDGGEFKEIIFKPNGTVSKSGFILFSLRDKEYYKIVVPPVRGNISIKPLYESLVGGYIYEKRGFCISRHNYCLIYNRPYGSSIFSYI